MKCLPRSLLLLGLATLGLASLQARRPNVVVIVVDDLGWTDFGVTGSDYYLTPQIDRLAAEGMRFTDAYAACTVCSPTRASIMTGKYPARLHLTDWISGHLRPYAALAIPDWDMKLEPAEITLAEALKAAGYVTAHIGKWHLGEEPEDWPEHHGFDINLGGFSEGHPNQKGPANGYFTPYGNPRLTDGPPGEYLTERLGQEAVDFIAQNADQPFFLNLWFYNVHTPLQAKEEKIRRYRRNANEGGHQHNPIYAAMVEHTDDAIGSVLAALERHQLAEDTIVILTSDNGGLIGNQGDRTKAPAVTNNWPLRSGKGDMYEGGVRVPFIVRHPGRIPAGKVSAYPIMSIDIYPTVLDWLGLPPPAGVHDIDGISLASIFAGTPPPTAYRELYWHYPHYHSQGAEPYSAVRKGPWKLIEHLDDGQLELYNLDRDIGESANLTATEPAVRDQLLRDLNAWRLAVDAQMPTPNPNYDEARAHNPR